MSVKLTNDERDYAATIVVLFSVLIYAWQTNDFRSAASTREKLSALGFRIKVPRNRKCDGGNHVR